jgi:hypothetical protein
MFALYNLSNGDVASAGLYDFLSQFLGEVVKIFPDPHLFLGGDEVHNSCYRLDNDTAAYLNAHPGTCVCTMNWICSAGESERVRCACSLRDGVPGDRGSILEERAEHLRSAEKDARILGLGYAWAVLQRDEALPCAPD